MTKEELGAISVEKQDGSLVRISGEIPFSYLEKHRGAALKSIGKDVEIDGFRKGHIPEHILVGKVGEMAVLSEMAERALKEVYPEVVREHGLDVIGYPKISITKIAVHNPLGFAAEVAVVPDITLPDYKAIAKDINTKRESDEVTPEEVDEQIKDIQRQKAAYERLQEKAAEKAETEKKDIGEVTELPTPETVRKNGEDEENELPIPELTDEYVKTLGQPGQFTSVDDFRSKLKEHLKVQKAQDITSRHRAKITDAIIAKTNIEVPQVMVDAEINQMFTQMEEDLNRAQLKFEDYLSHIKKSREDLTKEWVPSAEKRAKLQLILNEIAKQEGIEPDKGKVDHEISHLLENYKDADERRVRTYVESVLTNEAVLTMLENAT